ncbi:MAG: NAD(P)/FAD-dependent oxidoreductase [Ignavibacteriaceae bacterium]|nr:NAD(P)/FAD-dependent oxidoreductase [Ignavibacteriaceae bacterium]
MKEVNELKIEMINGSKIYIENFLDEFMLLEYKDRNNIAARKHTLNVFHQLMPKFIKHEDIIAESFSSHLNEFTGSKNIVVIGAGYGGLTAALRLERLFRKLPFFNIHLIDKYPFHTIKTQLHEAAVRNEEVSIPLDKILRKKKIHFHLGGVNFIDVKNKNVHLEINKEEAILSFNYLVIAIGSKVNYYNIPGMEENSFSLQTLYDADLIYEHISRTCALSASETEQSKREDNLRFVIGGGGLSGVEFAGELADHTAKCVTNFNVSDNDVEIIIIEGADRLVPFMDKDFSMRIEKKLTDKGIKIIKGEKIIKRSSDKVFLSGGSTIKTKNFIWTGGIRVSDLLKNSGLKTGVAGRVMVDEYLKAENNKCIFAIGDSANALNPNTGKPVPAAAQFALQQGRLSAKNIFAEIYGGKKEQYYPKVAGEVVSLGKHLAVGWMALPFIKKITFVGFLGRLLKAAIKEKHIFLLRKESRNWIKY